MIYHCPECDNDIDDDFEIGTLIDGNFVCPSCVDILLMEADEAIQAMQDSRKIVRWLPTFTDGQVSAVCFDSKEGCERAYRMYDGFDRAVRLVEE